MSRRTEPTPHAELDNFEVKCIVAGSRGYDDYAFFSKVIFDHIERFFKGRSLIFISGKAKTGADAMIIRFCKEHGFPWAEFPADWDDVKAPGAVVRPNKITGKPYNIVAGHQRNRQMAIAGTDLLSFFDGSSKGTLNMIATAKECGIENPYTIVIDVKKEPRYDRKEPKSR
jgi:hypothetical protein